MDIDSTGVGAAARARFLTPVHVSVLRRSRPRRKRRGLSRTSSTARRSSGHTFRGSGEAHDELGLGSRPCHLCHLRLACCCLLLPRTPRARPRQPLGEPNAAQVCTIVPIAVCVAPVDATVLTACHGVSRRKQFVTACIGTPLTSTRSGTARNVRGGALAWILIRPRLLHTPPLSTDRAPRTLGRG